VEAWDFSGYDLVISSSSAFAHGIITNGHPRHLCYVHSPARYLWDRTHDVLERSAKGVFGPLRRTALSRTFHTLRTWDAEAADRADVLLAASHTVQRRIQLYWQRESTVVSPPLDDFWLHDSLPSSASPYTAPYFFIASTLVPYKRIDLAIEACNRLGVPLVIAGEGRDGKRLQSLAGPTIKFVGYKTQEELQTLYAYALATLFPGDEDFGLVPLESLACGTPVIAYRSGGATETMEEDTTIFFDHPTADSLADALQKYSPATFDKKICRSKAARYSQRSFEESLRAQIAAL
jgi:glycosyltransferase involved in cell wall biosynthesis